MLNPQTDMFSFTIPLTAANHQAAKRFYQQHSNPEKARQIYLNTLSVQAVNFYLTCLGIKTDLEQSHSWNPTLQILVDTADLWVHNLGHLECRAVLPNADVCVVPPQVWSERIGYVAVQFNADLTEATLLGFTSAVEVEDLPLEELQPIDQLPEYLSRLAAVQPVSQAASTVLSQWLQNIVESSWQALEMLAELQEQPVLSFRTPATQPFDCSTVGARYGKFLSLGDAPEAQVLFLMEILPKTAAEYQIKMELYPVGKEIYLPRSLHVSIIDEAGKTILQAEGNNSEGLEFQFTGELGERFSVEVSLQEHHIIETFEI
ncbi:DUF1822 family protein [Cyanobacteria bacterium FACHB-471]|nr:DUF1822 family protein [Cyanobacteria bacterium FACHB-471]